MSFQSDSERWQRPSMEGARRAFISEEEAAAGRTWTRRSTAGDDPYAPIVVVDDLRKDYVTPAHTVHALKGINLSFDRGQLIAVRGRSGSGKTTFLNLIGGLDKPTSGTVRVDGDDITVMDEADLVKLRREKIGFVFQAFGLIPILSAAENVEIPLRLSRVSVAEREERVRILLELVGLSERANHRPHELSGGEQQRVALARALANGPQLLLADEPTGQLDSRTGRSIMNLILALVRSEGVTAIVATHDPALIDIADRVVDILDGQVIGDTAEENELVLTRG
ncbi:MAG TPA: ABC transporter ATP-binding protein [Thermomicrobiales bacterium]|nr:ABC transporter ATP-binding protein [Thermomicrobiales bacterium]